MNKINRIKRKLEQNKKKSIFQDIRINDNFSLANTRTKIPSQTQTHHNTLTIFPLISLCNSRDVSTDHSERSRNGEIAGGDGTWAQEKRTRQSIFCEKERRRGRSYHIKQSFNQTTAKSLNPSMRINWTNDKTLQSTERLNVEQFSATRTPQTVIIITEEDSMELVKTSFRGKALKRPSLIRRAYATVEERSSPLRKQSISAWETFDEERLL